MGAKRVIGAALAALLFLAATELSGALDVREIERVRDKAVLENQDLQTIDDFVAGAVQELIKTNDFTSIAKIRNNIVSNDRSSQDTAAAQYAAQFSESAYKHISEALKAAETTAPDARKFKITANLLILIDALENPRLAELAMPLLNDKNTVVRYWAVHAVTNKAVTRQLNSGGPANLALAGQITEKLKELVTQESRFEVIALIADFAGRTNLPQGNELVLQIADTRITKYADWTVEYELLDAAILKLLSAKISSTSMNKADVAQRFGQLYSYAIQRYVKGRDLLNDTQKQQLASVLAETEQSCISKLLGVPQSVIRKALDKDDTAAILTEHNRLLGGPGRQGRLAEEIKFDYGRTSEGARRTWPLDLPEPPENR